MSLEADVRTILKVVYKDPIQNLLGRHDPVFKDVKKEVWRGRELRFANIYSRSPAVASNHLISSQIARSAGTKNAEWVVPLDERQLFADTVVTHKQILASKDKKGAYQSIGQNLMFGSMSGLRRVGASLFYSKGFGEFGTLKAGQQVNGAELGNITVGDNTIVMNRAQVAGVDIGTQWQLADGVTGLPATNGAVFVITSIQTTQGGSGKEGDSLVSFTSTGTHTVEAGQMMVYLGNHNGTVGIPGQICAPHGLGALFPTDLTERKSTLYGVDRSVYPQRLSGAFVDDSALPTAENLKINTVNRLFNEVRQAGGEPTIVVVSANDYAAMWNEITALGGATNAMRLVQDTTSKSSGNHLTSGVSSFSFAMATSWLDKVVDTPFLEDGRFYILTLADLFMPTYSNFSPVDQNNNAGHDPGRGEDPLAESNRSEERMAVNIEDIFTVEPAEGSADGTAVKVTASLFYDLCAFNPANHGVGLFPAAA